MEIVSIVDTGNVVNYQSYGLKDSNLVISSFTSTEMDPNVDLIEVVAYSENNEFLAYAVDVKTYKIVQGSLNPVTGLTNRIEVDPAMDSNNLGLNRGRINLQYNFLKPLFNSTQIDLYWIKEISPSRTELKLASQYLSNEAIRTGFASFQNYVSTKPYYVDFYLNFGNNRLVIANNAAIVEEDGETYLLIKLYDPLPVESGVKDTFWICDKISDSAIYTLDIQVPQEAAPISDSLRGPNWRIKANDVQGQTTPYYNYNSLFSSNLSSSMQQLSSYYEDKGIDLNVDYTDFANFVHFSSATERINNFVYKLGLIEQYEQELQDSLSFNNVNTFALAAVSQSNVITQQKIDKIIEKFDVYEYYLYYASESFSWPKSTSTKPYSLYSVTSSEALSWLGNSYTLPSPGAVSILYSASYYDDTNKDKLSNSVPQYLLEDPNNQPYVTFIDMIGQHFDNIWLYYKDLSNRYASFNNPNLGVSKDVIADALRSFGFNLYTNTSVSDNLYYTLFGMNPDGSLLPPTGSEIIDNYVTSSIDTLSAKDLNAEVYKRLYHNLTYLLKTKGTQRGVKALICSYGIPEEILTINEFGGNYMYTGSGLLEINNNKIQYFSTSSELSNPVLSPFVTIQQYNTDYRINSETVEAGFSPADQINRNIVSSSGFFSMDQLIGNPTHQYLRFYPDLKTYSDNYFASYNYPHSIWEYIRIIKYYNNSLFKTIKDWVPAKSNASTGIIVKSHLLERNKYARTEPSMSFDNNISESIDMVVVDGSAPGAVLGSTQYTENVITPLGYASLDYAEDKAKITGRLSGSFVQATDGQAFDQSDFSTTESGSVEVDFPANYQNIITNTRSKRFLELDYAYNQNTPVNLGLITQSINNSINDNFNTYNDPYAPYADIQDYNYATRAFTDARYYGSSNQSATYNTYTVGDTSYGKTAAIDKIKYRYAYLLDIYTSSVFFPNRSNAQIKYLIDNDSNVLNLTKTNVNIFDIQNIFKSGETTDVALFEYDEENAYSQLLANNPTLQIYEGGWRYLPILHNLSGSATSQSFELNSPVTATVPIGTPPNPNLTDILNYTVTISSSLQVGGGIGTRRAFASASYNLGTVSSDVTLSIGYSITYREVQSREVSEFTVTGTDSVTILSGQSSVVKLIDSQEYFTGGTNSITILSFEIYFTGLFVSNGGGGSSGTATYLTTQVTSSQPCLYFNTSSNQLVLSGELSYYYHNNFLPLFDSTSDPEWNAGVDLPRVVLPFSIGIGDRISFYNTTSLGWDERWEYTIRQVTTTGSFNNISSSRYLIDTDRPVDGALVEQSVSVDPVTRANFEACRYIIWKHIPDETNVILRYNPKTPNIIEEGLLYPQYLEENVKKNAGNVVQQLKANNLI